MSTSGFSILFASFDQLLVFAQKNPDGALNDTDCLHEAVRYTKIAMFDFLLKNGCDIDKPCNSSHETPLFIALPGTMFNCGEEMLMMKKVLKAGANPNLGKFKVTDPRMHMPNGPPPVYECAISPLMQAVEMSKWYHAKLLLKYGANVNLLDKDGYTPFIRAVERGDDAMVRLLLGYGANLELCGPSGRTVHEIAVRSSTCRILARAAANKTKRSGSGGGGRVTSWPWRLLSNITGAAAGNALVATAAIVEEETAAATSKGHVAADKTSDSKVRDKKAAVAEEENSRVLQGAVDDAAATAAAAPAINQQQNAQNSVVPVAAPVADSCTDEGGSAAAPAVAVPDNQRAEEQQRRLRDPRFAFRIY